MSNRIWGITILLCAALLTAMVSYVVTELLLDFLKCQRKKSQRTFMTYNAAGGEKSPDVAVNADDPTTRSDIKSLYEYFGLSCRLKSQMSGIAELLNCDAEAIKPENVHIAEFFVEDRLVRDDLTDQLLMSVDDKIQDSSDESNPFLLDLITRRLTDGPVRVLTQQLIQHHPTAKQKIKSRKRAINRNYRSKSRYWRLLGRCNRTETTDSEQGSADAGTSAGHSGLQDPQVNALDDVNGEEVMRSSFRAMVIDEDSTHVEEAQNAFEQIRKEIDSVTHSRVDVKKRVFTAGTEENNTERTALYRQFMNEDVAPPMSWLWRYPRLPVVSDREFLVDSNSVWKYILFSTTAGAGRDWKRGTDPRDQQPTELPPESQLEPFEVDNDDDSEGDCSSGE